MTASTTDNFGRAITYLRLSITDRCNLRCFYCMPSTGVSIKPHRDILRIEEYLELVQAAAQLGISKVRLTGGEPLVRKGVLALARGIAQTPGIRELAVTTNGTRLNKMAAPLKSAGLHRVNLSLDTLDPRRFSQITRCGDLDQTLSGLKAAKDAGLPVTINSVMIRGVNTKEMPALIRFASEQGVMLRFIEQMPFEDQRPPFTAREALSMLADHFTVTVLPRDNAHPHVHQVSCQVGCHDQQVGFITPMSHSFCERCNKIRITPDGQIRMCLADSQAVDAKPVLRRPHTKIELQTLLKEAITRKPATAPWQNQGEMWRIGG